MQWTLQNSQTDKPLVIDISLVCNTPEDRIRTNVIANSALRNEWVQSVPANDKTAYLVGSGPSLADTVCDIPNSDVFALNGAAKYLNQRGIKPHAQIIMDARAENITLIGDADNYYFASQVDPSLLAAVPNAFLWHCTYGDELVDTWEGFKSRDDAYVIVGSALTVGTTALGLLYALGYRKIICHGFDSSHRSDQSHAFSQPMNDGDPLTFTEWGDKKYLSSLTMAAQAGSFCARAKSWKSEGVEIQVCGDGLLPAMWHTSRTEEEKYQQMWAIPEYRNYAPGEHLVDKAIADMQIPEGATVLDFGCGTGRGLQKFLDKGYDVTGVDIAKNCLDKGIEAKVVISYLWDLPDLEADFGYCTDVMEHIPPEKVDDVINNIMKCVPMAFFQISLVDDNMGALIGDKLHLSVHPFEWWIEKFKSLGFSVPLSEDSSDTAIYVVSRLSATGV